MAKPYIPGSDTPTFLEVEGEIVPHHGSASNKPRHAEGQGEDVEAKLSNEDILRLDHPAVHEGPTTLSGIRAAVEKHRPEPSTMDRFIERLRQREQD